MSEPRASHAARMLTVDARVAERVARKYAPLHPWKDARTWLSKYALGAPRMSGDFIDRTFYPKRAYEWKIRVGYPYVIVGISGNVCKGFSMRSYGRVIGSTGRHLWKTRTKTGDVFRFVYEDGIFRCFKNRVEGSERIYMRHARVRAFVWCSSRFVLTC